MARKYIVASIAGAAVVLSACGGPSQQNDPNAPLSGQTISVLLNQHSPTEDFRDKWLAEFTEKTGIEVNLDIVPESGLATRTNLALSQQSGSYDVIEAGAKTWPQLVSSGWLEPLDRYIQAESDNVFVSGFSEKLLQSLELDGSTYGIPLFVGGNMLYYNKQLFSEAGLDPDNPPSSTDELVAYAKTLNDASAGKSGIVLRGTREANANSFSWIMLWLLNGGRWQDAEGNDKFDVLTEPEAIKTAEQWAELVKYAPSGVASYNFNEAQVAMQQGEAAMWLDGAELGPALEDESQSTVAGKIGYHVMEGEGEDYIAGAVWGLSMVKGTASPDASWEFIKFMTGREVGIDQAISGANPAPARTDVLSDASVQDALNPEYAAALARLTDNVNPKYSPLISQGSEIRAALSLELSQIMVGKDPEMAMSDANRAVEAIVGK